MSARVIIGVVCVGLLIIAGHGVLSTAQDTETTAVHEKAAAFLAALADSKNAKQAVETLVAGGPLDKNRNANTVKLIEQAEQFSADYGKFLETEQVATKSVGRDLILLTYLYKTERIPVVWHFAFYRPPARNTESSNWRVVALSFDTNYKLLEVAVAGNGARSN